MTRGRSIFFGSVLAFTLGAMTFTPVAMADTSSQAQNGQSVPVMTALAKTEVQTAFTGTYDPESVFATIQYLFPQQMLQNNQTVLAHYTNDPNTPYIKFLDYEHQELYYEDGQFYLPYQAQSEMATDETFVIQNPMLSPKGIQSFYGDKDGVYQNLFMQSIEGDIYNQFFAPSK